MARVAGKWIVLFLLGLVAAATLSLVSQSLFASPRFDLSLFSVLILCFLGLCGLYVLRSYEAHATGGNLLFVAGKSALGLAGLIIIGILLACSLLLLYHIVFSHSIDRLDDVRLFLFSIASFLVLLVTFILIADIRFYENGVFLRGRYHEWEAIRGFHWREGAACPLMIESCKGLALERTLQVSISRREQARIEALLSEKLLRDSIGEPEAPPYSDVSLIP